MTREEIIDRICNILHESFQVNNITEEDYSRGLPSAFGLGPVSIVHLYILVQQSFEISIREQQLQNYGFNSINGICRIVADALK